MAEVAGEGYVMEWKTVDGYLYPIRVSERGDVQRQLKNGKWRDLKPYFHQGWLRLDTYLPDGKRKAVSVSKLVADAQS